MQTAEAEPAGAVGNRGLDSDPDGPALVPAVEWVSCVGGHASSHVPAALARYHVEVRSAEAEPASASGVAQPESADPTVVRGAFDLRVS